MHLAGPLASGGDMKKGIAVSPGAAHGIAHVLGGQPWLFPRHPVAEGDVPHELERLAAAMARAEGQLALLRESVERSLGEAAASMLDAQVLALRDPTLTRQVTELVSQRKINAEWALAEVLDGYVHTLDQVGDAYFRERATDIRDVGRRVMDHLLVQLPPEEAAAPDGAVLVVRELLPTLAAGLERQKVRAIVAEHGGPTSHAAIVARALEIPAVVGVENATHVIHNGDTVIVDGSAGLVFVNPMREVLQEYERLEGDLATAAANLVLLEDVPARTLDGVDIELLSNIGKSADAEAGVRARADGVGLFRTEFAYAIRTTAPTEDEQVEIIEQVAARFHPRPVVVRLLDVGADKQLSYLPQVSAANPALSERGVRLLLAQRDLMALQLRAILRAASRFSLAILLPMVAGVEEVMGIRAELAVAGNSLAAAGRPYRVPPLGVMIEVPAAALLVRRLAPHVDFFSVGTNDLVQYLLAADRDDPRMSSYCRPAHPAVLETIRMVVAAARETEKKLSVCGEMAADARYTELLIGLGLRSFSVSPGAILRIKKAVRTIRVVEAEKLARTALELSTTDAIEELLARQGVC